MAAAREATVPRNSSLNSGSMASGADATTFAGIIVTAYASSSPFSRTAARTGCGLRITSIKKHIRSAVVYKLLDLLGGRIGLNVQ